MQGVKLASSKMLLWGYCELDWDEIMTVLPWGLNVGMHALLQEDLLDALAIGRTTSLSAPTDTFEQCLSAAASRKSSEKRDNLRYSQSSQRRNPIS